MPANDTIFARVISCGRPLPETPQSTTFDSLTTQSTITTSIPSIPSNSFLLELGLLAQPPSGRGYCAVVEMDGVKCGQIILREVGEIVRLEGVESEGGGWIRGFVWREIRFAVGGITRKADVTTSRGILNSLGTIKISFHLITSEITNLGSINFTEDPADFPPTRPVIIYESTSQHKAKKLTDYISLGEPRPFTPKGGNSEHSSQQIARISFIFHYASKEGKILPVSPEVLLGKNLVRVGGGEGARFDEMGFAVGGSPRKRVGGFEVITPKSKRDREDSASGSEEGEEGEEEEEEEEEIPTQPPPKKKIYLTPNPKSNSIKSQLNELITANRNLLEIQLKQADLEFRLLLAKDFKESSRSGLEGKLGEVDGEYLVKKGVLDGLKAEWDLRRRREKAKEVEEI